MAKKLPKIGKGKGKPEMSSSKKTQPATMPVKGMKGGKKCR